jgi:hypothetical protein
METVIHILNTMGIDPLILMFMPTIALGMILLLGLAQLGLFAAMVSR